MDGNHIGGCGNGADGILSPVRLVEWLRFFTFEYWRKQVMNDTSHYLYFISKLYLLKTSTKSVPIRHLNGLHFLV